MDAKDYRAKRDQQASLTAEIPLPSGAVFTLRRPPLQVWIAAGKIPQSFLTKMRGAADPNAAAATLSDDETMAALKFVRDAICYASVSPKIVAGTTDDAELDPAELAPEDFQFLSQWVMAGSPGVPVAGEEGETSREALNTFLERQRLRAAGAGDDGKQVRPTTERATASPRRHRRA